MSSVYDGMAKDQLLDELVKELDARDARDALQVQADKVKNDWKSRVEEQGHVIALIRNAIKEEASPQLRMFGSDKVGG